MPVDAPELHDTRDGQKEVIKRINWLLRHQGGSGSSLVFVDGIATGAIQLSTLNSVNFSAGSIVYVDSVGDYFGLKLPTSVIAADGITRVDAFNKAGYQWERMLIENIDWQARTTWSVSTSGSDEAAGTAAAPLLTMGELARRVTGAVYSGTVPCIVTVSGDVNDSAFFNVTYLGTGPTASPRHTPRGLDSYFTIVGSPVVVYSGTISAPTTATKGSTAICSFADSSIPVSFTASGYLATDLVYRFNRGGTTCYAWPYKDLGAKTIQVSQPQVGLTTCPTLAAGDTYDIIQLPHVGTLRFPEPSDPVGVQLALVRITGAAIVRGVLALRYSAVSGATNACGQFINCRDFTFSTSPTAPGAVVTSGLSSVGSSGSKLIIGSDAQLRLSSEQGDFVTFGGITLVGDHADTVSVIQAMFYDCATPCLELPQEDTRFNLNTSGIGGSGNTDDIFNVSASSSWITYVTAPPAGMTSKGSPCTTNGVSVAVGGLPNNDITSNSFMCST